MKWKLLTIITISSILSSCGFQLRGSTENDAHFTVPVSVTSKRADQLAIELRSELRTIGALAVDASTAARIDVRHYDRDRSVAAVDQTGEVSIYRVTVEATVTIYSAEGTVISEPQKIYRSGNYDYDSRILNAMTQEEEKLVDALNIDLAAAIARKAAILLSQGS